MPAATLYPDYKPVNQAAHNARVLSFLYDFYLKAVVTREDGLFGLTKYRAAYEALSSHDKAGDKGKTLQNEIEQNKATVAQSEEAIAYLLKRMQEIDPSAPKFVVEPVKV